MLRTSQELVLAPLMKVALSYMAQALTCAILGQMAQGNPHLTSYGEKHGAEAKSDQCWQQLRCGAKCSRLMKVALSYILAHSYGVSPLST